MIYMADTLLKLKEVAAALRVTTTTVKRYITIGDLEAIQVGGGYRVTEGELARYIAANTGNTKLNKK